MTRLRVVTVDEKQSSHSKALAMGDPSTMEADEVSRFLSALIADGLDGVLTVEQCKALEAAAGRRLEEISMQMFELGRQRMSYQ